MICDDCDSPITMMQTPVYADNAVFHMGCDLESVECSVSSGEDHDS